MEICLKNRRHRDLGRGGSCTSVAISSVGFPGPTEAFSPSSASDAGDFFSSVCSILSLFCMISFYHNHGSHADCRWTIAIGGREFGVSVVDCRKQSVAERLVCRLPVAEGSRLPNSAIGHRLLPALDKAKASRRKARLGTGCAVIGGSRLPIAVGCRAVVLSVADCRKQSTAEFGYRTPIAPGPRQSKPGYRPPIAIGHRK